MRNHRSSRDMNSNEQKSNQWQGQSFDPKQYQNYSRRNQQYRNNDSNFEPGYQSGGFQSGGYESGGYQSSGFQSDYDARRGGPSDTDYGPSYSSSSSNQGNFQGNKSQYRNHSSDLRMGQDQDLGSTGRFYQEQQYSGRGPKGYRRSDERIKEDVCDALTRDGRVDASNVEVNVSDGVVTLGGTIQERPMKRLAEESVENIDGVVDVVNQIRVQWSKGSDKNVGNNEDRATSTSPSTSINAEKSASSDKAKARA